MVFRKYKKGYKVCRRINNQNISALNIGRNVAYNKRKWTIRPEGCGPLATFKSIKDAKVFIKREREKTHQIFKCRFKVSKDILLWIPSKYWSGLDYWNHLPDGTKLADKVKLLRKIRNV